MFSLIFQMNAAARMNSLKKIKLHMLVFGILINAAYCVNPL